METENETLSSDIQIKSIFKCEYCHNYICVSEDYVSIHGNMVPLNAVGPKKYKPHKCKMKKAVLLEREVLADMKREEEWEMALRLDALEDEEKRLEAKVARIYPYIDIDIKSVAKPTNDSREAYLTVPYNHLMALYDFIKKSLPYTIGVENMALADFRKYLKYEAKRQFNKDLP